MSNLGLLLLHTKGPEPAEPLLREALDVRKNALGEHPATAASLSHLARLLTRKGDAAEARRTYREALAMQRRLLGGDHTALTTTLNNLARELQAAGELEEAEAFLREAIAIWRDRVGDVHPHLAVHIRNLASVMADQGKTAEAEARYLEACSMLQKVHGDSHWLTADCRSVYGGFLTGLARYEEAEALLRPAHRVLEEKLGRENARTVAAVERLLKLYEAWGKPDKAAEYRAMLPDEEDGES
jgi:tetratricopeptide (TPR) repeat protein